MNIIRCFIASPADTSRERVICDNLFSELNKSIGDSTGLRFEAIKWETDVRPGFGHGPQDVINKQIDGQYDVFIGIMYKTFGTPTKHAGSGTEEEFNAAYQKYLDNEKIEIMFYFNNEPSDLNSIDIKQLEKVKDFKVKVSGLGGLYKEYNNADDFERQLRHHLIKLATNSRITEVTNKGTDVTVTTKNRLKQIFQARLNSSLRSFNGQPIIWVEPLISTTEEISENPDENFERRVPIDTIITTKKSLIIKAPPQFGLTCLSHYLVLNAWENGSLWIYLDSNKTKAHTIHNAVKHELASLELQSSNVECIILDSVIVSEPNALKKIKYLSESNRDTPIIVMQTIDDSGLFSETQNESIERPFDTLHLLALPRKQVRKVVSEYNNAKGIGEENMILSKLVLDLEVLNIHRTPLNCLTLLKVSEKQFEESPVNRTQLLERVLFILFNLDEIPQYKTKPDLKDCEFALGKFCENLIRSNKYEFSRDFFLKELRTFCSEKLFDIDVDLLFDILASNNIIIKKDLSFIFRSSYWLFYFAAKRMHANPEFASYIFTSKKYISFPAIIEFYTGIDRNRVDALTILNNDIIETNHNVETSLGLPKEINPFKQLKWEPTNEQIERMQNDIGENVLQSRLPDIIKDQYLDSSYNQIRPYDQTIQSMFQEYSLYSLIQKIKACSRALRNSDYVEPSIKRELFKNILEGWEQISKVLFTIAPLLAENGEATFQDAFFLLKENEEDNYDTKLKKILLANTLNIINFFKDDIFSNKIAPLIYETFEQETNDLKKQRLAWLIIMGAPRNWKIQIENYIVSLSKNSFFLAQTLSALRNKYRYGFLTPDVFSATKYLIKMIYAKHHFGVQKPGPDKIKQISNNALPSREDGEG